MKNHSASMLAGLFCLSVVLLAGCGSGGLNCSIVSGNITFEGKPIENGEIRFHPTGETPGGASGGPIVNGKYVSGGEGVPVGTHIVKVKAYRTNTKGGTENEREDGEVQYIPDKFNKTSTLNAVIKDQASQSLDFDLTRK